MATLEGIEIMLTDVAEDVSEIKKDVKAQNQRVHTNKESIIRLDTWVKLVAGGEVIGAATLCILKLTGVI